jgi:hypothetical protein
MKARFYEELEMFSINSLNTIWEFR